MPRVNSSRAWVDATRINEITEAADVGFGSFYNHFASKDAIVDAVVEQAALEMAEAISGTTRALDDRPRWSPRRTERRLRRPSPTRISAGC